jgi:hypothetical protein
MRGAAALTMRCLAERVGIRAPSLYKHFPDKAALQAAVIATGLEDAAAVVEAAVDGATEPLTALAAAYRQFALDHPHLYRLMNTGPLPRERLPHGLEDRTTAPSSASPAPRPAPVPSGRSPTAWSCSSSTTGSPTTPTSTPPGTPASPRSSGPEPRSYPAPRGAGPVEPSLTRPCPGPAGSPAGPRLEPDGAAGE